MAPVIRDAQLNDLPAIVEIYNSTIPSRMVTADTEPVTVEMRHRWFQEHNPQWRPLWVLEDAGEIVGWLSFQSFYGRPAYNPTVELSIYVSAQHRRKGHGRYLLGEALNFAPRIRAKTILGFIFTHNIPSLELFKSFGFERWGQFPNVAILDGIERSLTIVGKRIAP